MSLLAPENVELFNKRDTKENTDRNHHCNHTQNYFSLFAGNN